MHNLIYEKLILFYSSYFFENFFAEIVLET